MVFSMFFRGRPTLPTLLGPSAPDDKHTYTYFLFTLAVCPISTLVPLSYRVLVGFIQVLVCLFPGTSWYGKITNWAFMWFSIE
jgi:hypothetical protein